MRYGYIQEKYKVFKMYTVTEKVSSYMYAERKSEDVIPQNVRLITNARSSRLNLKNNWSNFTINVA